MMPVIFLVFILAQPALAQEVQSRDLDLGSGERELIQAVIEHGSVDDALIKTWSERFRQALPREQDQAERIQVLVPLIENALLLRNRDALITGTLRERIESGTMPEAQAVEGVHEALQASSLARALHRQAESIGDRIWVSWGYNRTRFGAADSTFHTPEGTFTIHGSQGYDRPTPFDPAVYFNPTQLSIPQYNLTVGWQFHPHWALELNQDHMKWVFDPHQKYEMSGEYSPTLYVDDPDAQGPGPGVATTFDQIKKTGDATWIHFEHTNGYNYVSASLVYLQPVFKDEKNRIAVDANAGAGVGTFIPQTSVSIRRDAPWNWIQNDNRFHIAGYGAHVNGGLRLTFFERVFFQATARSSWVKVTHALVDRSGSYLTQTPIQALELIGQIGWQGLISSKKRRR